MLMDLPTSELYKRLQVSYGVKKQPGFYARHNTGLFEMIVGVLTTCHTQYCTLEIGVDVFFFT